MMYSWPCVYIFISLMLTWQVRTRNFYKNEISFVCSKKVLLDCVLFALMQLQRQLHSEEIRRWYVVSKVIDLVL
jgi:hypothetical protein